MKIITYNPKSILNTASFLNEQLGKLNEDDRFVMFVYDTIIDKVKSKEKLVTEYENLMTKLDLPFMFFPYYLHFNKILPALVAKPSPRITVTMSNGTKFDVVQEPTFGLLILDVKKLKAIGFRFNEKYAKAFYLQDLILRCFEKKLYFSTNYFIDVKNSFELFDDTFEQGYNVDPGEFMKEKQLFYTDNKPIAEVINDFVTTMRNVLNQLVSAKNVNVEVVKESK